MRPNPSFEAPLLIALKTLQCYAEHLVVGGGWAPYLYHQYLFPDRKLGPPIMTQDIDLVVAPSLPVINESVDKILKEAGFVEEYKSRNNPPVVHYKRRTAGLHIEIEFLTDLKGPETVLVKKVQSGLHAEALRYISLLMENRTPVDMNGMHIYVPTPAAYVLHKGLIYRRRKVASKKHKDLYYVFDILTRDAIMVQATEDIIKLSAKHPSWFETFLMYLEEDFANAESDAVIGVAEQRPTGTWPGLNVPQFRQFVTRTFAEFIHDLRKKSVSPRQ